MDVGVKRSDELQQWLHKDPIPHLGRELIKHGVATQQELDTVHREAVEEVERSVEAARTAPYPEVDELHEHVFAGG